MSRQERMAIIIYGGLLFALGGSVGYLVAWDQAINLYDDSLEKYNLKIARERYKNLYHDEQKQYEYLRIKYNKQ